jgi:ketosteroid isomerase-like protein
VPGPDNVEIIRRLYSEFLSAPEQLTAPEMLEFFDRDVVVEQSASLLGTEGTFRGHEGLARAARESFADFRDLHWVPQRIEAAGDQVVATVESRGFGKVSGVPVSMVTVHTWTLRDGRVVRWHVRVPHADPEDPPRGR